MFAYTRAYTTVTPQSPGPQPPWPRAAWPDGLGDSWLEMMNLDCSDGRSRTGMLKDKGEEAEDGKTEEEVDLYICSLGVVDGTGILRPILKVLIVLKPGQVLNSMGATPELGSLMTHTSQRAGGQGSPQSPKDVFSYAPAPCVACDSAGVWWSMKCPALTHACVCFYVRPIEFRYSSIQARMVPCAAWCAAPTQC